MNKRTKELVDELLPHNETDLVIQAAQIIKLITKGPTGDASEDKLISLIFEIGVSVVKSELCKRCKHVHENKRTG